MIDYYLNELHELTPDELKKVLKKVSELLNNEVNKTILEKLSLIGKEYYTKKEIKELFPDFSYYQINDFIKFLKMNNLIVLDRKKQLYMKKINNKPQRVIMFKYKL